MNALALLLALICTIIPPVMAYKGTGFRGLWAGMIVIGFVIGLFCSSIMGGNFDPKVARNIQEFVNSLFFAGALSGFGFSFGSLLAVCFYRKPQEKAAEAASPSLELK